MVAHFTVGAPAQPMDPVLVKGNVLRTCCISSIIEAIPLCLIEGVMEAPALMLVVAVRCGILERVLRPHWAKRQHLDVFIFTTENQRLPTELAGQSF